MSNRIFTMLMACIALLLGGQRTTYGQTDREFRETVRTYFHQIDKKQNNREAVLAIDDSLLHFLKASLPKIPESLYANYISLSWRLTIATAPDSNVRFWSWTDGTQGSIQMAMSVAEWRSSSGIMTGFRDSHSGMDTIGRCDSILTATVDDVNSQFIYYIGIFTFPISNGYKKRGIQIFKIDEGWLTRQEKVFSSKEDMDELDMIYRIPKDKSLGPFEEIEFTFGRNLILPAPDFKGNLTTNQMEWELDERTFFAGGLIFNPKAGHFSNDIKNVAQQAEHDISRFYDSSRNSTHGDKYDDSLRLTSSFLSAYLKVTLPNVSESLEENVSPSFDSDGSRNYIPREFFDIASSSDRKMCIWSWNTYTGGSMPSLENLVEYRTGKGIKVIDLESDLGWGPQDRGDDASFDTIFLIHTRDGKTIYLPRGAWKGDGRNSGKQLEAFEIDGGTLNTKLRVFPPTDTFDRQYQYELSVGCEDCKVPQIKMDGSTLYVQHIDSNDTADFLSSKFDEYEFDGEHFVYRGVSN